MPFELVPLMYLSTLLVAMRWQWAGECMNYDNLFTEKVMSGRVKVRYWRAPIIVL